MRPLDLDELSRSDYVLVSLLIVGEKVVGYSIVDKIVIASLRDKSLLSRVKEVLRSGAILRTVLNIHCEEGDTVCIEHVRKLGLEPGKDYEVSLSLAALSVNLLDLERLRSLAAEYLGDALSDVLMVYGSLDYVTLHAVDLVNYLGKAISEENRESENPFNLDHVLTEGKIIVIEQNGSIRLESLR